MAHEMRSILFSDYAKTRFFLVLTFLLLAMTARPATDPDLWWHLRTGELIVETGHVPQVDPFSFTRSGHPWLAHEWLSDVLFFELWKHGGAAALTLFAAVITTCGFLLLYSRCSRPPHWAAAAAALGALAAAPSWGVRPQMFTFAFASLLLWLIERGEQQPKALLWIPPLFLLWLNLHAGFALAIALLLTYGAGLLWETATGAALWNETRPLILRTAGLLSACLALVPLNPNGFRLYRYPFETLFSSGMRSFIVEWASPDFHQELYLPLLVLWLTLIVVFAFGFKRSSPRLKARIFVPLLFTAFASLDAVRHVPIFVLMAVPVIAAGLPLIWPSRGEIFPAKNRAANTTKFRSILALAVMSLIVVFMTVKWVTVIRDQTSREAEVFPEKALSLISTSDYPRNLFVYYDWGGYTIWKLYPQHFVFIDGRADLYGDEVLRQFRAVMQLGNGWRSILDSWKIEAVIVPPSSAVAQALLLDTGWRMVFRDSQSVILLKDHPSTSGQGD
jgi:hypothetical protein